MKWTVNSGFKTVAWLSCLLPPVVFVIVASNTFFEVTDAITGAGLLVLSPLFIGLGFIFTAALLRLCRWIVVKVGRGKVTFVSLSLATVALINLGWGDWRLLLALELATLPPAFLFARNWKVHTSAEPDSSKVG